VVPQRVPVVLGLVERVLDRVHGAVARAAGPLPGGAVVGDLAALDVEHEDPVLRVRQDEVGLAVAGVATALLLEPPDVVQDGPPVERLYTGDLSYRQDDRIYVVPVDALW
jgi:hypothetical protein